jgi:tetratricopeptide (TPR) repeat protein
LDGYPTGPSSDPSSDLPAEEQEDLLERLLSDDVLPLLPLIYEQAVASLSPEHQEILSSAYDEHGVPQDHEWLLANHPDVAAELGRHVAAMLDQPPEYGTGGLRSMAAWRRYQQIGKRRYLNEAIGLLEEIRAHPVFETDHEQARLVVLSNSAACYLARYEEDGDLDDVHRAMPLLDRVVEETPEDFPLLPGRLQNRGTARLVLYERLGEAEDLDRGVRDLRLAVEKTPSLSPYLPDYLDSLGNALRQLYARSGDLTVLDEATRAYRRAVDATPEGDPRAPRRLSNLGTACLDRFGRTKDRADFDEALGHLERAVHLSPSGSPGLHVYLGNLGGALRTKFLFDRDLTDIDRAVDTFRRAAGEAPAGSPVLPGHLSGLGGCLLTRAEYTKNLRDLDEGVEALVRASGAVPATSPHLIVVLNNLARGYSIRFDLTGDAEALEKATQTCERACRLSLDSGADPEEGLRCARSWLNWAFRRGAWEEAVRAHGYAERLAERLLRVQLFRAGKESWLGDAQGLADRASYALAKTGDLAGAVTTLERGRARLLTEVLDRDRADLGRLGEVGREDLRDRYAAAVGRWAALHDAAVGIAQGRSDPSLSERDLLDGMRAARAELDDVMDEIRRVPGYELFQRPSSFEEIVGVAEEAPLVYLITTFVGSLALVVAEGGAQAVWLPATAEEIGDLLVETGLEGPPNMFPVVGGYLHGQLSDPSRLGAALAGLLPRLGEAVVAPVAGLLRSLGAREAVLVPDGRLGSVPLHAATYAAANGDGDVCLLDEFDVSYAPNARSLGLARAWAANAPAVPRMAGVGNPLPAGRSVGVGRGRAQGDLQAVWGHRSAAIRT